MLSSGRKRGLMSRPSQVMDIMIGIPAEVTQRGLKALKREGPNAKFVHVKPPWTVDIAIDVFDPQTKSCNTICGQAQVLGPVTIISSATGYKEPKMEIMCRSIRPLGSTICNQVRNLFENCSAADRERYGSEVQFSLCKTHQTFSLLKISQPNFLLTTSVKFHEEVTVKVLPRQSEPIRIPVYIVEKRISNSDGSPMTIQVDMTEITRKSESLRNRVWAQDKREVEQPIIDSPNPEEKRRSLRSRTNQTHLGTNALKTSDPSTLVGKISKTSGLSRSTTLVDTVSTTLVCLASVVWYDPISLKGTNFCVDQNIVNSLQKIFTRYQAANPMDKGTFREFFIAIDDLANDNQLREFLSPQMKCEQKGRDAEKPLLATNKRALTRLYYSRLSNPEEGLLKGPPADLYSNLASIQQMYDQKVQSRSGLRTQLRNWLEKAPNTKKLPCVHFREFLVWVRNKQ